ncbi:MAG: TonB-dependent receptor [Gammaproteobacteria bacterium]|nr:TonB-dependent receptor [Gammaproteobacteria bacterium]
MQYLKWRICATAVSLAVGGIAVGQEAALEEVTVTGSRIRASGFTTPTPVTTMSSDELEFMAPGNLIESVSQLPIFFNNTTQDNPGNFFGTPGSGSLNIRGLNANRTLTLLNGRRMTPSNRIGAVDINSFPEVLVERVEVVTGGASAAYGTNAVAGVANFILDTDFDGLNTHAQIGDSSANGRGTWEIGVAFGTPIGERSHLIVSAEAYEQDGVFGYDSQDWYQGWGQVRVPGTQLDLVVPNVVSTQGSQNGIISAPGSALDNWEFRPDGTAGPFVFGSPAGGGAHSITNGGSGTPNGTEWATLSPEADRHNIFLYYDFDLNDSTNFYVQATRGQNRSLSNNLGGVFTGASNGLRVYSGNAFLPAEVQAIMDAEGLESFSFQRFGSLEDVAAGGGARQETENTSTALTLGFEKNLSADGMLDGWQIRGYVQSGQADHIGRHKNGIRIDRIPAAVDAVVDTGTGDIVCYAALQDPANWSDCVPLNLFGAGNASPEALDYVTGLDAGTVVSNAPLYFSDSGYSTGRTISYVSGEDKITDTEYTQDLIEFSMDGQIAEGWAGPILAGFGVHYREEEILQIAIDHTNPSGDFASRPAQFDPTIVRGVGTGMSERTTAIQFASVPNLDGGFDVTEAFAEFIVPLVSGKPGVDSLTATLASRWADYEPSGDIQAWKYGLDWQVNDSLRVRSTVSRDVRAATLAERLDRTGGVANIEDRAFGPGARFDTSLASGGNPNLKPEEADTRTVGLVIQPQRLSGFQASIDWYEIDITGAVGQLGIQALVDECFDFPNSSTCNLVHRDPNTNVIVLVENVFVNINAARASGVDYEFAYRADVGPGSLGWRFLASQLNENSITNFGAAKVDFAGDVGIQEFPDVKVTTSLTWDQGPVSAFLQARYIGSGLYDARDTEGVTISDNTVDSVLYTDLRISYGKDLANGSRWEVFGNITNLFDEEPPIVPSFSSFTGQTNQVNAAVHDILGRRYTLGFRYEL